MTFVPQQASIAVAGFKTHEVPHCTVWLLGQVITGGVVSMTVTIWLHVMELEQQSVARQVRVTISGQKLLALVTVLSTVMVTFVPQQASMAVGAVNDHGVPQLTVRLLAQVRTGGCVSTSVIVWLHVAVFEQQSMACQVRV